MAIGLFFYFVDLERLEGLYLELDGECLSLYWESSCGGT